MPSHRYALPGILEMTCINYWVENCVIANVFGDKLHRARILFFITDGLVSVSNLLIFFIVKIFPLC